MAEKKHLFGTSEKSDFILNMTQEGVYKMCGVYCTIAFAILAICAIPYYLTRKVLDYTSDSTGMLIDHFMSEKFIAIISTAVAFLGIFTFMIFIITCIKKQFTLKGKADLIFLAGVIVCTLISMFAGYSAHYGFFGYINRADGFLVFLGYVGFFVLGMLMMGDKWKKRAADVVVGFGIFQAAVGIIQGFVSSFPSYYSGLFAGIGDTIMTDASSINDMGYIMTDDLAANGFLCSPFALAAVLTICFAVAMGGLMYDKNKARKIIYGIGCVLMVAASVLTHVLPALIGIPCVAVVMLVVEIVRLKSGNCLYTGKTLENPIMRGLLIVIISGIAVGALGFAGQIKLCDENIMFTDSFARLSTGYHQRTSETEIYSYLRSSGATVISDNKLLGTGPDCVSYELSSTVRMDRFYNEYIDFMAQKGILTFVFYALFLLCTLIRGVKACARFITKKNMWLAPAAMAGVVGYLVQAFFNTTSTSSTYMLWFAMGLVWAFSSINSRGNS